MTGKEKYEYWEKLADYDIETAEALIKTQRWTYVAVLCQQSAERIVKGMHIYHNGKEAPKSHNIMFLMNKLSTSDKFLSNPANKRFIDEKGDYEDFVIDLMFYYINDYPFSYKNVMERFIKEEVAVDIYNRTLEFIKWLKSFQN